MRALCYLNFKPFSYKGSKIQFPSRPLEPKWKFPIKNRPWGHRSAWLCDWPFSTRECVKTKKNLRECVKWFPCVMREKHKNSAWIRENLIFPAWFRETINFQPKFCDIAWKHKFSSHCVNAWKRKKICDIAWLGTPWWGLLNSAGQIFKLIYSPLI